MPRSTLHQGDVITIDFDPQSGHEQAGRRPAVVVSNYLMNEHFTVIIACPITHTNRNNPFHFELSGYSFVNGYAMCEQVKTMDPRSRNYRHIGQLRNEDITEILERIGMLIEKE